MLPLEPRLSSLTGGHGGEETLSLCLRQRQKVESVLTGSSV